MLLRTERESGVDAELLRQKVVRTFKNVIGVTIDAQILDMGTLPRSEKKTQRVIDRRYE